MAHLAQLGNLAAVAEAACNESLQREGAVGQSRLSLSPYVSHSLVTLPGQLGDLKQKFSLHSLLFLRLFSCGNQLDPEGVA